MKYGERKGGWCTRACTRARGCGLWWSISEGWDTFVKHFSFVVRDGSRILFWHDKWTGDVPLKILYPQLWMYMIRLFEIDWVMPGSVVDLLFCWYHWLGKHSSDIWNLVSFNQALLGKWLWRYGHELTHL